MPEASFNYILWFSETEAQRGLETPLDSSLYKPDKPLPTCGALPITLAPCWSVALISCLAGWMSGSQRVGQGPASTELLQ